MLFDEPTSCVTASVVTHDVGRLARCPDGLLTCGDVDPTVDLGGQNISDKGGRLLDSGMARRSFSAVVAGVAAVGALAFVSPGEASADPGNCGVRVAGPNTIGGRFDFAYEVKNQCGYGMNMEIQTPSDGFHSGCSWVAAYNQVTFFMNIPDPNWKIIIC
ncbi:hypothetical protein [Amycolatopsis lexingtonensis]|uniref:hypothetical protein n=1 Tax=Amycolatopsis lexingtonensis TaxID=218822 RepID=UPI003F7047FA